MSNVFLHDLLIIFGLSSLVVYLFTKLKLPSILGFFLAGFIAGPNGFSLLYASNQVNMLSNVGVILIMFSIGMELSLQNLFKMRKNIMLGGGLQMSITMIIAILIGFIFGAPLKHSIFLGFMISLSSTAIIMKLYAGNAAGDSPQGKTSLGILIFQDLAVIPFFLAAPLLAGKAVDVAVETMRLAIVIPGIGLFLYVSAKWIMPNLIFQIAKTGIKELFILVILMICAVTVLIAEISGLSLAIGAFLAGLLISETDYNHDALGFVAPFKDVLSSFFFFSIGMLLNFTMIWHNIFTILALLILIMSIKIFATGSSVLIQGYPGRIAFLSAFALAQIGEFSFILSKLAYDNQVLSSDYYQIMLAVIASSMGVAPFLFDMSYKWASYISKKSFIPDSIRQADRFQEEAKISEHVIVIGYGVNGFNIVKALKFAEIPYIIIESNPVTVKSEKAIGENIIFGDASRDAVLKTAGIKRAKIVITTIPDPISGRSVARTVKRLNPNVYLIVRSRFVQEMEPLFKLGADDVIPDEFETSIEILSRTLAHYLVPKDEIEKFSREIRAGDYESLRGMSQFNFELDYLKNMRGWTIQSLKIGPRSRLVGKSIVKSGLRDDYGAIILAVNRGGEPIPTPSAVFVLNAEDIVILFGRTKSLTDAYAAFN